MEKLDYLLIDTDILIDAGCGIERAIDFLDKQNKKYKLAISIITEMWLIVGCRNKKELKKLENFLENLQVILLNPEVLQLAVELLKEYRLKSGLFPEFLKLRLNIIEATCKLIKFIYLVK